SHSTGFVASDLLGTLGSPIDPRLGPLQANGGQVPTRALLSGSPAIDAGDNANAPFGDGRGLPRIINGTIDIGAYEFGAPSQLLVTSTTTSADTGDTVTFTVTAQDPDGNTTPGFQGTIDLSGSDP